MTVWQFLGAMVCGAMLGGVSIWFVRYIDKNGGVFR